MNQLVIAERLISLRKKAGLSQSAVAELLSVTRQAVSKWESGKASPSLEAYSALAALYHTSIEAIVTGSNAVAECELTEIEGAFFAERLKNLRILRSLSQGEVSEALSVSRQSVSKWERGEAEPDGERLVALSQLFRAPLSLLLPYTKKEMVIVPDETPVVEEETPVTADEAPAVEEETLVTVDEAPVVEDEPPIVEGETPVTADEAPVVEEETPVVEDEPPIVEDEAPVTADEAPAVEDEAPVVEEETPTVTVKQDEPTQKRYRDMLRRAAAIRKKKKEEKESDDTAPPFRTISDVGPNDPAYVYVGEDDKKLRTMLPLLAAIPLAVATVALIFRKK